MSLERFAADWPAISVLLDEALALPPDERAGWLAALDEARAGYRDALQQLLATQAEVETNDFLQALPHLPDPDATHRGPSAGETIGPWRLVSEIARGGMGTVWLAERADGLVRRPVALKLPHAVWGDAFAARLARERHILASLEHPHIARLYDTGLDDQGRPYIAMEYVEGLPIDAWCRERDPSLRERLQLLLQVLAAVAHAHSRLVVHRDLKPANILVTPDGQAKLLDFGIAKLIHGDVSDGTALTELAGSAMTVGYASPEQIRGEPLGTASDVYSLGVVACELLTGQRPYTLDRASVATLAQAIDAVVPRRPSELAPTPALRKALRGDIDAIVGRALEKAPARRYAGADAFAQDIERHLRGEPVQAHPPGRGYRAAKFVGRYRVQVAAGAAVAIALVAGASVATWQAREARAQAQRARTEAQAALAVQGFLEKVFTANSADQVDPRKARSATARELLDRGAQRIDTELRDAPYARLRLLQILASMYEDMELEEQQLALCRKRLELARELTGPASDETVLAIAAVATALTQQEKRAEAQALLTQGAAILDARKDQTSQARLSIELRQATLDLRTDREHGEAAAARAVAIARRGPPSVDLSRALELLGQNAYYADHYEIARAALAESIALRESHPQLGASQLFSAYITLGGTQRALGDYAQARASYLHSVDIARKTLAEPAGVHFTELEFANFLFVTGRFKETIDVIEPAWRFALTGDTHNGTAGPLMVGAHGRALIAVGRIEEGLVDIARAQQLASRLSNVPDLDVPLLAMRARGLLDLGHLDEARETIQQAHDIAARSRSDLKNFVVAVQRRLMVAQGQGVQALAEYSRTRVAGKLPPLPGANEKASVMAGTAWLALAAGDTANAEAQARQALASIKAGKSADYQRDHEATATLVLGQSLLAQRRFAEARPVLEQAVALHRAEYDEQRSPALAETLLALADCRHALGQPDADPRAEAGRILATHPGLQRTSKADAMASR
jgi:serine/threonine-protein kinase